MGPKLVTFPTLEHSGRLGNQLWQIASTVGIARNCHAEVGLPVGWSYRDVFSCPDRWFSDDLHAGKPAPDLARTLDRRVRPYLQDLSLWAHVADEIRAAFEPAHDANFRIDDEWAKGFRDLVRPITAVHIRRGDYATNPLGAITSLPIEWYAEAISIVDSGSVVVFSDDIEWCRGQIDADLFYEGVVRPKEQESDYLTTPVLDWIDIFLMARCDAKVISNSTYSWWAAWLSDSPDDVIYPGRWFGRDMARYIDWRAMIPNDPRWRQLPCP